jgi:hypothetical protein
MQRHARPLAVAVLLAAAALAARADDGKPEKPEKPAAPKATSPEAEALTKYTGPEIAWVRHWSDAVEEAAERNLLLMVHSHGST